ncbi:MAG TPA: hypothetical protein VG272_01325 [Candidatus Acidoferrales bacterium]|jgi:hypothetical protein|nr:hypothetical protein [Candidatus Acidoferrales bacterium]HWF12349.1 hypothetical protein [Candidatus Acidoferrales bacterium]
MTDFRAKRAPSIPGRGIEPIANARLSPFTGREKRRGERLNSRVPIALEWNCAGQVQRKETQTRVVGPYGCMVVLPSNIEVKQTIRLTNMVNKESNQGVIVWRGMERAEGWELGIELINPQMGFWGLDL